MTASIVTKGKSKDSSSSSTTSETGEASSSMSSSSSMKVIPGTKLIVPEAEVLRLSDHDEDDVFSIDFDKTLTPSCSSVRHVPSAKKPRLAIVSKEDIFVSSDSEDDVPLLSIRPPIMLLTRIFIRELEEIPSPCLLQIITIVRTTALKEVGKLGINVVIRILLISYCFSDESQRWRLLGGG